MRQAHCGEPHYLSVDSGEGFHKCLFAGAARAAGMLGKQGREEVEGRPFISGRVGP